MANNSNPLVASAAGAVIGAAAGAVLADKKTRNMVKGKIKGLQRFGTEAFNSMTQDANIKGGQSKIKRALGHSTRSKGSTKRK